MVTHLVGCAHLMSVGDLALLFGSSFAGFVWPDPSTSLASLLQPSGDVSLHAPVLRRLGGDDVLLAAAREIVAGQLVDA